MHRRSRRELWYALAAIVAITGLYLVVYQRTGSLPEESSLAGHGIGIAGFTLMLMTEALYSIRKQMTDARWGSMAAWLRFHIFTGLLGPFLVLLHTSMRFHGLAGGVMFLTLAVVASGVVGRYIYTALPRPTVATVETAPAPVGADGAEQPPSAPPPDGHLRRLAMEREALSKWRSVHIPLTWALFATALVHAAGAVYYATLLR